MPGTRKAGPRDQRRTAHRSAARRRHRKSPAPSRSAHPKRPHHRRRAPGGTFPPDTPRRDLTGLVLAPGFIDVHSHADNAPLLTTDDTTKILQGVTTEVVGNCGFSLAPFSTDNATPSRHSCDDCSHRWTSPGPASPTSSPPPTRPVTSPTTARSSATAPSASPRSAWPT
ncbi:amidohydrolase family protein [Saccharopolyspora phatthalungensis]|uniref:amidohydrolase family protein n=1 Tax=Saccharopolyspora phatthalungensis TaxID=664693 RepID=UPI000A774CD1|nr:amidohydrolase family protein [Saccharopolyspora phatthalungensis]